MNETTLREALQSARRAPSIHNSQPWKWILRGRQVELHVDRTRLLGAVDPDGREALLSDGAALDHLCVAMAALGWQADVDTFPNPNDVDHVATLTLHPCAETTRSDRDRRSAMLARRTDRLPMAAPVDGALFVEVVRPLVESDAVMMDVLASSDHAELAEISRLATADRRYDRAYQAELDWWTHTGARFDSGIAASQRITGSEEARVDVGRDFPVVTGRPRRPELTSDSSMVVVLSTRDDSIGDVLGCGIALSTILLEATMAGLHSCTVTHITESAASRDRLRELIHRDRLPQVLIRIGSVPVESTLEVTRRRPVDDLLTVVR